jgi:hypothetical protein
LKAINLLLPDGLPSRVWACGECKLVAADEHRAVHCCEPIACKFCGEPTEAKLRHGFETSAHDACDRADRARRDMERMERAEKLEDWDGWVWDDGRSGIDGNGYFQSLDDYVEELTDEIEPDNWPEWVHVTRETPVAINLDHVLESLCEGGYEDMADDLKGVEELQKAVDVFNEANKGVIVYDGDYSRAVRVSRPVPAPALEGSTR